MQNHLSPEIFELDNQHFSQNHCEHWQLLTDQDNIIHWIQQALDLPSSPMGLCPSETQMNPDYWLIQGPTSSKDILCTQVHAVQNNKPQQLTHAFPTLHSPYAYEAKINLIKTNKQHSEAILSLQINDTTVFAFDNFYTVNRAFYNKHQKYNVHLSAWAYRLEPILDHETVTIDDPNAIRHHRALNDILAEHQGKTPDNLQSLLQEWQPKSEADKQPITIDISKTMAYLYGDSLGQEDEAWFQGQIVGKTQTQFMGQTFTLYDVIFIDSSELEANQEKVIVRLATKNADESNFDVGQFIRGDIWLQATIFNTCKGKFQQF